jgi:hypothetical protein
MDEICAVVELGAETQRIQTIAKAICDGRDNIVSSYEALDVWKEFEQNSITTSQ